MGLKCLVTSGFGIVFVISGTGGSFEISAQMLPGAKGQTLKMGPAGEVRHVISEHAPQAKVLGAHCRPERVNGAVVDDE